MRLLVLSLVLSLSASLIVNAQDGFVKGEPALAYWRLEAKGENIIILHGGHLHHTNTLGQNLML